MVAMVQIGLKQVKDENIGTNSTNIIEIMVYLPTFSSTIDNENK